MVREISVRLNLKVCLMKDYTALKKMGYSWQSEGNAVSFLNKRIVLRDLETGVLIFILNVLPDRTITELLWTVSNRSWHSSFRVLT